nr:ATP-binding cassette, subfamily G (WHITE), member 3-like 4 isoform X2 [Rattus norvegicus]
MSSSNDPTVIPMTERRHSDLPETNTSDPETLTGEAVVLSFHNISYIETVQSGFPLCQKTRVMERLSSISGIMGPGLNAIMGPQDGSRSLLLDVLAARRHPSGLSGDILVNGKPRPANFKCTSGYVPHNDVVMHTVTVRDNLEFSAALCLPMTITRDEKRRRINEVLELLHLDEKQNTKPRSKELRKRTSIAVELIADHPILFLDNPTTYLDFTTTTYVISVLRRMSMKGKTIIFSINQPQYSIFRFFDSLTLMASGKLMFHGPARDALEYFTSAGYPADFFLDIINGGFCDTEEDGHEVGNYEELFERQYQATKKLVNMYAQSRLHSDTRARLDQILGQQQLDRNSAVETTCATPFWHQLMWITYRSFKNIWGFPWATVIQAVIIAILAALIGIAFQVLKNDCNEVRIRAGLLYLLTIFQSLTSVFAGVLFVINRHRFLHEHTSGYYRVSCYFFGKLLADLIPRRLLPSTIVLITYFIAGGRMSMSSFFAMLFTVMMLDFSVSSLPLSIGAGKNAVAVPTLFVTIYFVFMLGHCRLSARACV